MIQSLKAPKVKHYISILGRVRYREWNNNYTYDSTTYEFLDELFTLIEKLEPVSPNGARQFWVSVPRGTIEDYAAVHGTFEELREEGEVQTREEYERQWQEDFPNEVEWYLLGAVEEKDMDYRAVYLHHKHVIEQDARKERCNLEHDISDFAQWLVDATKAVISELEAGTYNARVARELPVWHRTGTITRDDLWRVYPQGKENYFANLSQDEIDTFLQYAIESKSLQNRLPNMTANDFYSYCAMGYLANNYEGCELTPKLQYRKHADGRDEGLSEIDPDSPEAFATWYDSKSRGYGHPWEVCRGGNSTHIDLYAHHDKSGWYLTVAGSSLWRSAEAIKFFVALYKAGIPVSIHEADRLKNRLLGTEKIGIVPDGVFPSYCHSFFKGENVIDFRNLPFEEDLRDTMAARCTWQPIEPVHLITEKEVSDHDPN